MANATIVIYKNVDEFRRGKGVVTRLLIGKDNAEETIFTSGTTVFPPGCSAPMHSHNCSEQVTILRGEADVSVDGSTKRIGQFDTSFIQAHTPQCFLNVGESELVILWIYGAREVTRTFTETGETVAHLSNNDQV